jgi:hypothetical protein
VLRTHKLEIGSKLELAEDAALCHPPMLRGPGDRNAVHRPLHTSTHGVTQHDAVAAATAAGMLHLVHTWVLMVAASLAVRA